MRKVEIKKPLDIRAFFQIRLTYKKALMTQKLKKLCLKWIEYVCVFQSRLNIHITHNTEYIDHLGCVV